MRTKTDVYDHMLRIQGDMAFPYEQCLYQTERWAKAERVLDFGTGNGHYLKLLRSRYRDKSYLGIEHDAKMAERAQQRNGQEIKVITGSIETLPEEEWFDYLLVRLVGLHLPDRSILTRLAARNKRSALGVLIIDADDEYFLFRNEPKKFRAALEDVRKTAINRNLRELVKMEWEAAGYKRIMEHRIIINSDFPNNKERMYCYMCLTAELVLGSPLPKDVADELFDWLLDPASYVQYGIFGSVFERS